MIGVIDIRIGLHLIIIPLGEIPAEKIIGHPFPPVHAEIIADIPIEGNDGDTDQKTAEIDTNKKIGHVLVFLHQGRGKIVADITEGHIDPGHRQRKQQDNSQDQPGPQALSKMTTKYHKSESGDKEESRKQQSHSGMKGPGDDG